MYSSINDKIKRIIDFVIFEEGGKVLKLKES